MCDPSESWSKNDGREEKGGKEAGERGELRSLRGLIKEVQEGGRREHKARNKSV